MINLVLISHGSLAAGIREAAEMILGEQENLIVLGLYPGDTVDSFSQKLEKAVDSLGSSENVLVLTDIPSGTPANAANRMVLQKNMRYLSGCNLPMLLEVLSDRRDETMDELVRLAIECGKDGIVDSKDLLARLDG